MPTVAAARAIFTNGWSNDQIAAVAQKIYDLAE